MKAWPSWFKKTTLGQILYECLSYNSLLSSLNKAFSANHSNFDINAEENSFSGLDFSALDTLAGYNKEQTTPVLPRARAASPTNASTSEDHTQA